MVAYSFQRQFEPAILAGTKSQTIRKVGKRRHAQKGDLMQLYVAMRTKHCTALGVATCFHNIPVTLDFQGQWVAYGPREDRTSIILAPDLDAFARNDGFEDWQAMCSFWRVNNKDALAHSYQWTGRLIMWGWLQPPPKRIG